MPWRASLIESTNRRAGCERSARPVRREGGPAIQPVLPTPIMPSSAAKSMPTQRTRRCSPARVCRSTMWRTVSTRGVSMPPWITAGGLRRALVPSGSAELAEVSGRGAQTNRTRPRLSQTLFGRLGLASVLKSRLAVTGSRLGRAPFFTRVVAAARGYGNPRCPAHSIRGGCPNADLAVRWVTASKVGRETAYGELSD